MAALLEHVVDKLDRQLAIRRRELSDLRMLIGSTTGLRGQSMRRAAHVAAYAHWEGFSKFAIETYLQYLCDTRRRTCDLRSQLKALSYLEAVKAAATEGEKVAKVVALIESIELSHSRIFSVDPKELTRVGNMMADNLRALLDLSGLDFLDYYATKSNLIDASLCGRRHRIAHGSLEPVQLVDAIAAIDLVDGLCARLNDQLQHALIYEDFLADQSKALPEV